MRRATVVGRQGLAARVLHRVERFGLLWVLGFRSIVKGSGLLGCGGCKVFQTLGFETWFA